MSFIESESQRRSEGDLISQSRVSKLLLSDDTIALTAFIVVGYLSYGLFFAPAIFMDDWTSVFERIVTSNAKYLDLTFRNPLLFTPFLIQYRLLALNVTAYYIVLWSFYIFITFLLYKVLIRFPLPESRTFSITVALLFLVYPTVYTHMWLIQLGIYCAFALTLLYGYLLLRFAEGAHWSTLALAITCLIISFGFYEGQLGIASAWVVLLAIMFRHKNYRILMGLMTPLIFIGIFSIWRTLGFQTAGLEDQYLSHVVMTPSVLLSRWFLGYKVSLAWGWTIPLENFIPRVSGAKPAAFLLLTTIVVLLLISNWAVKRSRKIEEKHDSSDWAYPERWPDVRLYLYTAVAGIILVASGYVPVLIVYLPSLSGIGSRHNMFATIGSALFIASVLMIGVLLIAGSRKFIRSLLITSAIPLILLGIITQTNVQINNKTAWIEQKKIWQELFSLVPDVKDGTTMLFIMPGYQDRSGYYNWKRTPLSASWEASSGVRLLYENFTLNADVYFPDIEKPTEPILTTNGVLTRETNTIHPFSRTVAFIFNRADGTLTKMEELPADFMEDTDSPITLCEDCILSKRKAPVPFRILVQK